MCNIPTLLTAIKKTIHSNIQAFIHTFIQIFIEPQLHSGTILGACDIQGIEWTRMPALMEATFQQEAKFTSNKAST